MLHTLVAGPSLSGAAARALSVYAGVARAFRVPGGWDARAWRGARTAACGLTALAARAALRDAGVPGPLVRDPARLARPLARLDARLLALSWSGASAEVQAALALAQSAGRPAALVTAAARPGVVRLPPVDAPASLAHLAFCAALPPLLGRAAPPPPPAWEADGALRRVLEGVLSRGGVPLVVAPRGSAAGAIHAAYCRELLRRPAVRLVHPDWTHDFLWAFERAPIPGAEFLVVAPAADLPDRRLPRVVAHLRRRGHPVHLLPGAPRAGGAVARLLALAGAYAAVAEDAGMELDHELGLDDPPPSPAFPGHVTDG